MGLTFHRASPRHGAFNRRVVAEGAYGTSPSSSQTTSTGPHWSLGTFLPWSGYVNLLFVWRITLWFPSGIDILCPMAWDG